MPELMFPQKISRPKRETATRSCPGHRAWVRKHHCSVPRCSHTPIECAHVRNGTDGGTSLKPSDKWVVSLCAFHHREQHQIGERAFEQRYSIELLALAQEFAKRSPHRLALEKMS